MTVRRLGIAFLLAEAVGAAAWWGLLLAWPPSRASFLARGAPDATLLAFGVADGVLYVGTAAAAAVGLANRRRWAWPVLCAHAGAAAYAALYCWTLTALTGGDAWLGAVLMTPSLVVPGWVAWKLRPNEGSP
jgi:predicted MFS family arabinose efflux permease